MYITYLAIHQLKGIYVKCIENCLPTLHTIQPTCLYEGVLMCVCVCVCKHASVSLSTRNKHCG